MAEKRGGASFIPTTTSVSYKQPPRTPISYQKASDTLPRSSCTTPPFGDPCHALHPHIIEEQTQSTKTCKKRTQLSISSSTYCWVWVYAHRWIPRFLSTWCICTPLAAPQKHVILQQRRCKKKTTEKKSSDLSTSLTGRQNMAWCRNADFSG